MSNPKRDILSERRVEGYLKYAEIIQYSRKNVIWFIETILGIELLDYQKYVIVRSWHTPYVVWTMSRAAGKALALDTKIPTPNGFTNMGDLKIGDEVLSEKGKPTKITHTSDIFLGHKCYRVTFSDGAKIVADADHLWLIKQEISDEHEILTSEEIFRSFSDKKISNIGNEILIPLSTTMKTETDTHKKITYIEEFPSVPTKCITVENPTGLFLCGERNTVTHNSTVGAIFIMAKSMLFPNYQTYILAGSGSQSQEMFLKMEQIAMNQIASFTGLTDIFANETVTNSSNSTGFTHSPASFEVNLYNGSTVNSLNSVPDNIRSKRSNLNFYDESGFTANELFEASEPFAVQSSDFRLGGDSDVTLLPKQVPNQLIYASSASATDTYFYEKYRDFSKRMYLGDSRYFVADIDSDAVIGATLNGKLYPVPLLSQETVDNAMRKNPEQALREYGNIFTTEGADEQIIKRAVITRNSELRKPVLAGSNGRKFLIAIDPARSFDNSVMTIAELINDPVVGFKLDIVNMVSFADVLKKKKTPIRTPEQIKEFKRALLNYNGAKAADYENIEAVLMDDGSGGGGVSAWADNLLENWKDEISGIEHKGLIDTEHEQYKDSHSTFPNAVDKLGLIAPGKLKNSLFAALREMMNHDLISFPENYDGKGELVFTETDGENAGMITTQNLSEDERMGLVQIDIAKEELVSIHETKSPNGKVTYGLAAAKRNRMNDDRAYTIAMLAWYLQELRRENVKKEPEFKLDNLFMSSGV